MVAWTKVPASLKVYVKESVRLDSKGRRVWTRAHWRWNGPYAEQIYAGNVRAKKGIEGFLR